MRAWSAAHAAGPVAPASRRHGRCAVPAGRSPQALRALLAQRVPRIELHHRAVAELAGIVADDLGLARAERDDVVLAAGLHDIGKVAVPRGILDKPGALDPPELAVLREHTIVGHRILCADPGLRPIAALVRSSHERWDGSGYPDGLRGEEIPLGARIITICDAYDAMTNERPYRPARPVADALAELRHGAGRRYDPSIVPVFLAAIVRLIGGRA
jgi:HD-GYP domain-containing protein (c-di-GMP phosphodiesterase class II)